MGTEGLTEALAAGDASSRLAFWGAQATVAASSLEYTPTLDDLAERSSAIVVGTIVGVGDARVIEGDSGTDDAVAYPSVEVEIAAYAGGSRRLAGGDRILVELFGAVTGADAPQGSVAVLFLRHKRDGVDGQPFAAFESEPDVWRLVNDDSVFVDRGDGVAVNPLAEAVGLDAGANPVAAELDGWTISELLDRLGFTD